MNKVTLLTIAAVCLTVIFSLQTVAQDTAEKPAKYVYFDDDKVNSGKYEVYSKMISQVRDAAATTSPDIYWIAATPITGDGGVVTFVTFADSMAGVEKFISGIGKAEQAAGMKNASMASQSAESQAGGRYGLVKYREDLSYRATLVPTANTAWWSVGVYSLRPGCEKEFEDVVKQVMEISKKTNSNDHWITYEAVAGGSLPEIVFVKPMRSLAEEDEELPAAAKEAFDSPLVSKMFETVGRECITHVENTYSKVEPSLSRPTQAMVAANPDFWNPKAEAMAGTTPVKKGKTKVKPAAVKTK